jgi:hypothetical protein
MMECNEVDEGCVFSFSSARNMAWLVSVDRMVVRLTRIRPMNVAANSHQAHKVLHRASCTQPSAVAP